MDSLYNIKQKVVVNTPNGLQISEIFRVIPFNNEHFYEVKLNGVYNTVPEYKIISKYKPF